MPNTAEVPRHLKWVSVHSVALACKCRNEACRGKRLGDLAKQVQRLGGLAGRNKDKAGGMEKLSSGAYAMDVNLHVVRFFAAICMGLYLFFSHFSHILCFFFFPQLLSVKNTFIFHHVQARCLCLPPRWRFRLRPRPVRPCRHLSRRQRA